MCVCVCASVRVCVCVCTRIYCLFIIAYSKINNADRNAIFFSPLVHLFVYKQQN